MLSGSRVLLFEGGDATDGEQGDDAKELGELGGATFVELVIGAVGVAGDFHERLFCGAILPLVEHEGGDLELSELGGTSGELVEIFFAGIADEDEGVDFAAQCFLGDVTEHTGDLGGA